MFFPFTTRFGHLEFLRVKTEIPTLLDRNFRHPKHAYFWP